MFIIKKITKNELVKLTDKSDMNDYYKLLYRNLPETYNTPDNKKYKITIYIGVDNLNSNKKSVEINYYHYNGEKMIYFYDTRKKFTNFVDALNNLIK